MTRAAAHLPMLPPTPPCHGGTASTSDTRDTRDTSATHPSTRTIAGGLRDTPQPTDPPSHG